MAGSLPFCRERGVLRLVLWVSTEPCSFFLEPPKVALVSRETTPLVSRRHTWREWLFVGTGVWCDHCSPFKQLLTQKECPVKTGEPLNGLFPLGFPLKEPPKGLAFKSTHPHVQLVSKKRCAMMLLH